MDVNCCRPYRYLFVNKATGNVLEVKTEGTPNNPGPLNWQLMYSAITGLSNINSNLDGLSFSNPVDEFLEINCKKDFEHIEIYDLHGKQTFQKIFKQNEQIQRFDVSSLRQGLYIVKIFDKTKNILTFKILKK